jgi:hypothetical protein
MQLALSWIFITIIIVYKRCKLNKWNLMKSLVHLVCILMFKLQLKGIQDATLHWLLELVVNMWLPTLVHFKSRTKRAHIPTIGSVKLQQSLLYFNRGDNFKDKDSMPLMINFHEQCLATIIQGIRGFHISNNTKQSQCLTKMRSCATIGYYEIWDM